MFKKQVNDEEVLHSELWWLEWFLKSKPKRVTFGQKKTEVKHN